MKLWTSSSSRWDKPKLRTTDSNGRRLRGYPNWRHSAPAAVNTTVFPSCLDNATCRAWVSMSMYSWCWRPSAVNVTDSHGVPVFKSNICFSRFLSTRIQLFLYLRKCVPGLGMNSNCVTAFPWSTWNQRVRESYRVSAYWLIQDGASHESQVELLNYEWWVGMLNDNRKFVYRIKCSFSFSFVSHSILDFSRNRSSTGWSICVQATDSVT